MKKILLALVATLVVSVGFAATSVTQNGITWTFDKDYPTGQFVNGDWWVVGPVKITAITNNLNSASFTVPAGANGSMIDPIVDRMNGRTEMRQGYDERLGDYVASLNAARPNGSPLSSGNPLTLQAQSSLVSVVSWLWRSTTDREPGCPAFSGSHPRSSIRSAAVLTCLVEEPPADSFRPPYCGSGATVGFNVSDLRYDRLQTLPPVTSLPNIADLTRDTERVWLDHIPGWYGGQYFHPTLNMPNYGREMTAILQQAMLALHLDWDKLAGKPSKERLAIQMVQMGIDLAGIADAGGYWPADGGHGHGRKPAILFAGLLLDDAHMMNVGNWKTAFQDNDQTFYVTSKEIENTNHANWNPDSRDPIRVRYVKELIGMPEWGIRHAGEPLRDTAFWSTMYRDINAAAIPGFALAFLMFEDGRRLFNHDAYFDYADRLKSSGESLFNPWYNRPPAFAQSMWAAYRDTFPSTYDTKWDYRGVTDYITGKAGSVVLPPTFDVDICVRGDDTHFADNQLFTLRATATASGAKYQWFKNGEPIEGATKAAYTASQTEASADYHCRITVNGVVKETETITITTHPFVASTLDTFGIYETKLAVCTSEIRRMNVRIKNPTPTNPAATKAVHAYYRAPIRKNYTIAMAFDGEARLGYASTAHGYMWSASDKEKAVPIGGERSRTKDDTQIGSRGLNIPMRFTIAETANDGEDFTLDFTGLATTKTIDEKTVVTAISGVVEGSGFYPLRAANVPADAEQSLALESKDVPLRPIDPAEKIPNLYYPPPYTISDAPAATHFLGTFTTRYNASVTKKNGNNFSESRHFVNGKLPRGK